MCVCFFFNPLIIVISKSVNMGCMIISKNEFQDQPKFYRKNKINIGIGRHTLKIDLK